MRGCSSSEHRFSSDASAFFAASMATHIAGQPVLSYFGGVANVVSSPAL